MSKGDERDDSLDTVGGDGSPEKLGTEAVQDLRTAIFDIVQDARIQVQGRRSHSQQVFNCEWDGQSDDGRKHAEVLGRDAHPFEGASDMRIRLANQVVNEKAMVLKAAVERMTLGGLSSAGAPVALDALSLFTYVKKNLLAERWGATWRKVFHWTLADAPALGVVGVFWRDEVALREREVSVEELVQMAASSAFEVLDAQGIPVQGEPALEQEILGQAVDGVMALVADKARAEELAAWLSHVLPAGVSAKTLKRVARDLQRDGRARVPVLGLEYSGPEVRALRVFEDVFFPSNTTDIQAARVIVLREWVSAVELRNRQFTLGYAEKWVDAVLEKEGVSYLPMENTPEEWTDWTALARFATGSATRNRGLYEVLTVYQRAANEDGVPGIFISTLHGGVDFLAKERELLDYPQVKYPFVLFQYEMLSHHVWDSRSIPELASTDQYALKLLNDSFNDHTSLSTVPPVKVSMNRPDFNVLLGPMEVVREVRKDEVTWMTPPTYPQTNDKHRADIKARVDEFFGRFSGTVPPELTQLMLQGLVDDQLPAVGEVVIQVLQLCGRFMDPATAAAVLSVSEEEAQSFLAQLSGRLMLEVSFDTRMLNMEWLKTIGNLVGTYLLAWDTDATVDRAKLSNWFAYRIDPGLARSVLRPVEEAAQSELLDEDTNMSKIQAGVEPPMMTAGQNYGARLARIYENMQKNPEYAAKLTPNSRAILEARIKHLQGMVQQQENAQIGRTMARPALEAENPLTAENQT